MKNTVAYLLLILFTFSGFLVSCTSKQPSSKTLKDSPPSGDYNKCFSMENGYADIIYTDTIIRATEAGNFFKKVSINDTQYVYSCGRGTIEKLIDTFLCSRYIGPSFHWETEEFIALIQGCGTYCWSNTIIPVATTDSAIHLSYSSIDLENMNAISVGNDSFWIQNLRTRREIGVPIAHVECINRFTLFAIDSLLIKGDTVSYQVACEDGSTLPVKTSIDLSEIQE